MREELRLAGVRQQDSTSIEAEMQGEVGAEVRNVAEAEAPGSSAEGVLHDDGNLLGEG